MKPGRKDDGRKDDGRKDDAGKLELVRLLLLPDDIIEALLEVCLVFDHGAQKYGAENWRKLENLRWRYLNAAVRHIRERALGQRLDKESAKKVLAHAICGLLFTMADDAGSKTDE